MASAFSHVVAAATLGSVLPRRLMSRRLLALGATCALLPDLDVVAFALGIPSGSTFGHRGVTHSLLFAAVLAATVVRLGFRDADRRRSLVLIAYLFLATASHGVLDAMTNGGRGIQFFAPFDGGRYFLPWRPIEVSPIGVARFFSARGAEVIRNEIVVIWLPALLVATAAWGLRRSRGRPPAVFTARNPDEAEEA